MSTQPTAVLVHGAFADASGFAALIRRLQAQAMLVRQHRPVPRDLLRRSEQDIAGPMAVSQRPLAAAAFTEPASAVGWTDLPSWYLVSERDNAIPPDCERFMAQRMNAEIASVDGSHAPFIAQPDVASGLILKAVSSL